jgi:prepilin-type N-terminal cleavage/methylation domain-containing protein
MLRRRLGFTLVEMVVALALTGIVLSLVSAIALRQQRLVDDLADQRTVAARLREAATLLPIQLRGASPSDLRDASDTSLELRATIATAIVCDTVASKLVLAPAADGDERYASFVAPIEAGDSIWILTNGATPSWRVSLVTDVGSRTPGGCGALGPSLTGAALRASRVTVTTADASLAPIGLPVRVTRPVRYSVYRASDGNWYVGEREWNNVLARFNAIQPVVGPFLAASAGLSFGYADTTGASLPVPVADRTRVARIDVTLHAQTRNAVRAFGSASTNGKRTDSTVFLVALRNRP